MSSSKVVNINCVNCGKNLEGDVWSSINSLYNPNLVLDLLNGDLNIITCKECGKKHMIPCSVVSMPSTSLFDFVMFVFSPSSNVNGVQETQGLGGFTLNKFSDYVSFVSAIHSHWLTLGNDDNELKPLTDKKKESTPVSKKEDAPLNKEEDSRILTKVEYEIDGLAGEFYVNHTVECLEDILDDIQEVADNRPLSDYAERPLDVHVETKSYSIDGEVTSDNEDEVISNNGTLLSSFTKNFEL
jgi:hypothetical protein